MAKKTSAAPAADERHARTGPGELRLSLVPIDEIKFRARNAKRHGDVDVAEIASSLDQFDQRKNVVLDAQGYCVAGEGTVRAARRLGWTHVWASAWDAPGEKTRAYALADNRVAEIAPVDYRVVAEELQDLSALGATVEGLGWDEHELAALLGARWSPVPAPIVAPEGAAPEPAATLGTTEGRPASVSGSAVPVAATSPGAPVAVPPAAPVAAASPGAPATPPAWPAPTARWVCFDAPQWERVRPAVERLARDAGVTEAEALARLAERP